MKKTKVLTGAFSSLLVISLTGCGLELDEEEINLEPRYADVVIADVGDDVDTSAGSNKIKLTNADFEAGNIDPWFANGDAVLTIESTEVESGSYSLKVTDRVASWNGAAISFVDTLTSGHTYTISVRVKTANVDSADITMTVKSADGDGEHYSSFATVTATNTDWIELTGEYSHQVVGAETAEPFIYVEGPAAEVEYYVDSLTIIDNDFVLGGDSGDDNSVDLANADFESGDTSSWTVQGDTVLTLETSEVQQGTYSSLVTGRTSNWHAPIYSVASKLVAGNTYTISAWVKLTTETAESVSLSFKLVDDGANDGSAQYINIATAEVSNAAWVELTGEYTHTLAGAESEAIVYIESAAATADYYIDSLSIMGEGDPESILINGDFELGTGDSFDSWGAWNGSVQFTAESTEIHGGSRAVKAVGLGTDSWRVQLASDGVATVVGNDYQATYWIKAESAEGIVQLSTSSDAGALYGENEVIATEWQQVTWVFTANDVMTNLVLNLGASEVTYYLDDVELIPLPSEPPYVISADTVVLNGDLELGLDNDFDSWGKWNNSDGIVAESTEIHSGARGIKVTNGSDFSAEYQSQLVSEVNTLVVGTSYTASAWIKGTVDGEVRFSTNETTAQYGSTSMVTADWAQITWTFTATEEATRIVLDLGKTPDAIYYLDDIELIAD